jgi:hypothetical protein
MPRPTTKTQLLAAAREGHARLEAFLATQTPAALNRTNTTTGWSVKDVLAHLTAWEQMVLDWYRAGLRGEKPAIPGGGYTWAQLPALNARILKRFHNRPLARVKADYATSFDETVRVIEGIGEADLFSRGRFAWTGTTTLGAYFVSNTSSHYAWALKLARQCVRPAQP